MQLPAVDARYSLILHLQLQRVGCRQTLGGSLGDCRVALDGLCFYRDVCCYGAHLVPCHFGQAVHVVALYVQLLAIHVDSHLVQD